MNRSGTKILTVAVVLLLFTNIGLVALMVWGKKGSGDKRRGRGEPGEMMIRELGMNEEQKKKFFTLRDEHFKAVRPLMDSIRQEKVKMVNLLSAESVSDSLYLAYSAGVRQLQDRADRHMFEHFREVRQLLTADQQGKYDEFVKKMIMQRGRRDTTGKK
jgi:Spy/CpxP family protein refolding chaperone